jgi:hypothetical protein
MTHQDDKHDTIEHEPRPYRVRLPGFITDKDVGLGDVIKHVASTAGISPCGGCLRRMASLNSWLTFTAGRQD